MRKLVLSMLIMMTILLVGCGDKKVKPIDLDKVYTCKTTITLDEFETSAQLERLDGKNWMIVFLTPDTLTDVEVYLKNDVADVSYKGLEFSLDRTEIPLNSMIATITSVLDGVALGQNLEFFKNGENVDVKGKIDKAEYSLTVDKNGTLLKLDIPTQNLTVQFSDFELK